jgi:UDP-N-acetyl-D-glucosamine dehydrogenase
MATDAGIPDCGVVAVVGLGYVGLPLCRAFHDAGLRVIGFDIDPSKIERLTRGENYLMHLGAGFVSAMRSTGRFEATGDERRLREADAVLICVPTPLDEAMEPDLSYVDKTTAMVARNLRAGQVIVLESTTYPGTTRERMKPVLEAGGLVCGRADGFFLAFSPEREDPGRKDHSVATIPKLVGGVDGASTRAAGALYRKAVARVIEVRSAEVAESAKLLENIYRGVNIALVNELKTVFDRMGIDVWEVIEAASTKPFGFQAFYPGPGLGGHCIPIDPFYLSWRARSVGGEARFIELAGRVNHAMPAYVVKRTLAALAGRGVKAAGAKILVLGLAYKPDIDDVRESPSFELIEQFRGAGAAVDYHDPHVPATHAMRRWGDLNMRSIAWSAGALAGYDAVVISTHHAWYDWAAVCEHARLVVDTRGVTRGVKNPRAEIVRA